MNPSWRRVCWFWEVQHSWPPHKFERNWFQKFHCVIWKKLASKIPVWYSTFILQEGKIREPKLKKGLLVLRGSTFTASSQYANVIWRYGQNQAEGGSQGLHCCVLTKYRPVTINSSMVLFQFEKINSLNSIKKQNYIRSQIKYQRHLLKSKTLNLNKQAMEISKYYNYFIQS